MRLSGLSLAVILLSASVAFAQHGGGGGGGSSGGGGSHGGGGGSGFSGGSGGHSSGGGGGGGGHSAASGGHSSASHGSSGHGSNTASVTRTGTRNPSTTVHPVHEPNGALQTKATPEKRAFFSFLHHPFHRPRPKTVIVPHPPFCRKGPCRVCPPGKAGRGCAANSGLYVRNECRYPLVWNSGNCVSPMPVYDTCDALLREAQREAQRMQAAQLSEQSACSQGQSQTCMDAAAARQNEEGIYQTTLENYRRCRMRGASYPSARSGFPGLGAGLSYDPFRLDLRF